MLTWLLVGLLGMIWAAFLLPSRKRSPTSSVEEFERKMTLLAEANNGGPGRWVLMPRKGQRFVGSRDRERVRARRRRRQVFMVLLELTALTLLMGIFPPFRVMLLGTGILAFLLLAYSALLVKIREAEQSAARVRAVILHEEAAAYDRPATRMPVRVGAYERYAVAAGNGHMSGMNGNGNGHGYANGNGHGTKNGNGLLVPNGHGSAIGQSRRARSVASHGNGNGNGSNGNGYANPRELPTEVLREGGVQIIEDDVHVIVRRIADFEPAVARPVSR